MLNNRRILAEQFAENIKSDKIDKIILFSSVAREDDTEYSDIDILINKESFIFNKCFA